MIIIPAQIYSPSSTINQHRFSPQSPQLAPLRPRLDHTWSKGTRARLPATWHDAGVFWDMTLANHLIRYTIWSLSMVSNQFLRLKLTNYIKLHILKPPVMMVVGLSPPQQGLLWLHYRIQQIHLQTCSVQHGPCLRRSAWKTKSQPPDRRFGDPQLRLLGRLAKVSVVVM